MWTGPQQTIHYRGLGLRYRTYSWILGNAPAIQDNEKSFLVCDGRGSIVSHALFQAIHILREAGFLTCHIILVK